MIYAYSTPEIPSKSGWTKIGYTEQDVKTRIKQQTKTVDVTFKEEWRGMAVFDDGSGEKFNDKSFHAYLRKLGIKDKPKTEWFNVSGTASQAYFYQFKSGRGIINDLKEPMPYQLRKEQEEAVLQTMIFWEDNPENGEFLWNAKPRFGKTLSVYDFIKQTDADNVLIVTNRPAIANSWYSDYEDFLGTESGYRFVTNTSSLVGKPLVRTREEYVKMLAEETVLKCIQFVSLQDLKGSKYFGGIHNKLREVKDIEWDILVIDEAHEGVDTFKTDIAFNQIKRKFTLHLSGTPFKALANDKFPDNAIFNWTYADEQKAKANWASAEESPYETLPKLNLFTYQLSEIIKDEIDRGIEINGETKAYSFELNDFFSSKNGRFIRDESIDKFLDALTFQMKFPFSTDELRDELKHTFWILNRVDSAILLAKKLQIHPIFKDYFVVLAAGDGKIDDEDVLEDSYKKVKEAINTHEKTITISVGQLTTGVTIPEWTGVMMLSNIKSPALYMQAAFRAQNPCLFNIGTEYHRKENAYVFDFDPARTLKVYEQFANDLSSDTTNGNGDTHTRKKHIKELLNFFPVIGEDENGEMIELDAEKVLSIPRKIRSLEVVRRGFMSDFLFQNISNIFRAPSEVLDIIKKLTPVDEPSREIEINEKTADELSLDDSGEVKLDDQTLIGTTSEIFGDKIYEVIGEDTEEQVKKIIEDVVREDPDLYKFNDILKDRVINTILDTAMEKYSDSFKRSEQKQIQRMLEKQAERIAKQTYGELSIAKKTIEQDHEDALRNIDSSGKTQDQVNQEFEEKNKEVIETFKETVSEKIQDFTKESAELVVDYLETKKKEEKKDKIEDSVRDHLRGFSRTIPSFLMAYGDDTVTLNSFDKIIPDEVFKEVTGISLTDFSFLRDGGKYYDKENGDERHYPGKLFDPVVFDDSVREFMRLRRKLANYFGESATEDIFDYIPPQKTNQIYTPKKVVKKMVDLMEEENPGCYDSPEHTFIDLYMKSGLYITEIVKRLYQSEGLKKTFPDTALRLKHIFENQVYGLAPTEIIFKIATKFILGFEDPVTITTHNFKQVDTLPFAQEGTLETLLEELYG